MRKFLQELLEENISEKEKSILFSDSLTAIQEITQIYSYQNDIAALTALVEKNLDYLDQTNSFSKDYLQEYVSSYNKLMNEYSKYQIWLVGTKRDCRMVKKLLNYNIVHILGEVEIISPILADCDYILVCSSFDGLVGEYSRTRQLGSCQIIRFDFFLLLVGVSPESAKVEYEASKKLDIAEGIVTGMSYVQRGIDCSSLHRNFICLAKPSSDYYIDFQELLWAYHELEVKRKRKLKYCILDVSYYRLWYDSSKGTTNLTIYHSLLRRDCLHHYHFPEFIVQSFFEDRNICNEIMEKDYINTLMNLYSEKVSTSRTTEYFPNQETYENDKKAVEKAFDKEYPLTFQENIGILRKYFKFCQLHDIKCLCFIPAFPDVWRENIPSDKKDIALRVIQDLQKEFSFDFYDMTYDKSFTGEYFADWQHLNDKGATRTAHMLNDYMDEIWKE